MTYLSIVVGTAFAPWLANILNRNFIQELEQEGCNTQELRKDIAEIEAKIAELQMKCRFYL